MIRGVLINADAARDLCCKLRILGCSAGNKIGGPLPEGISALTSLLVLSLPFNSFTGGLPQAWLKMNTLETLSLVSLYILGPICRIVLPAMLSSSCLDGP